MTVAPVAGPCTKGHGIMNDTERKSPQMNSTLRLSEDVLRRADALALAMNDRINLGIDLTRAHALKAAINSGFERLEAMHGIAPVRQTPRAELEAAHQAGLALDAFLVDHPDPEVQQRAILVACEAIADAYRTSGVCNVPVQHLELHLDGSKTGEG